MVSLPNVIWGWLQKRTRAEDAMQLFKSRKKNVCSQIWQQMTASDSNCLHAWVRKLPAQELLRTVVTPGREVSLALPRVLVVCLFVCLMA